MTGPHTATVLRSWDAWEQRDSVGPALDSLATWMAWWRGCRQELVDTEEAPGRVLLHLRHRGSRDGREIDERLALLFYLDETGRITRWEPWSDPEAAARALRA